VVRPDLSPWRDGLRTGLHVFVSIGALTSVYFVAPMDRPDHLSALALIAGAVALSAVIGALQIRSILRSRRPSLRAIEALAFSIPLLILSFASIYFLLSQSDGAAFTEPLSRTDALYFGVTVFATVGFGDIAPASQPARLVVTIQMICNLLVLGIGLRVVVGAVQVSRQRQG